MRLRSPFALALPLLAACPAGKAAQVVQPDVPSVADAERKQGGTNAPAGGAGRGAAACTSAGRADLMVVDWQPEMRGDLEVAMKEGLVVVKYDCASIELVSACSLDGSYGYIGTTRRDKKIEMNSKDEIAANLPVGGLSWLSDLGGKLGRESALVAQLVMVGKRSAGRKQAERGDLQGGCDGATHYLRAATVGAFAVAAGSKAELAASAKIAGKGAGASSSSSTKIEAQDGDLDACAASKPDSSAPPDQCGAIVRVELEPIGGEPPPADVLAVVTCPPGFVAADGACRRPSAPHQCTPGDAAGCGAQCDAGHGGSCAALAVMHRDGAGVAKDWGKAASLAERACAADVSLGCRMLATAKLAGEGVKKDKPAALVLLAQACDAGDTAGCVELGQARLADKKLAGDAVYAFRRACYGGEIEGCAWLGTLYADGKGGQSKNPKIAVKFFEKGCKEGSPRACTGLADLVKAGQGIAKDKARAKALYAEACNRGYAPACKKA
jgi:uncharacterized protein